MLNAQTTKNIADAFHRSVQATLVRNPGDACLIVPSAAPHSGTKAPAKLLMITISSFSFRLVTVFRIPQEPQTNDYYTGGAKNTLDEVFAEVANMCCGAFGRELAGQFKHLAMSVPYGLDAHCVDFLNNLQPSFQASYDISINAAARIWAAIFMCCTRPVEFTPAAAIETAHVGGELELF
jgi:hypothetical protein